MASKKYSISTGIEKKKLMYVTFGNFGFIFLVMLTNLILPLFGIINLDLQQLAPIFTLGFIVPTFFALQRYRFFNFSNASLNFLRKLITYGIFLGGVTVSYILLANFFDPGMMKGVLSAFLALIIFKVTEGRIPILVTSGFRHFKDVLNRFKSKVYYCNSYYELEKLTEEIFLIELNFVNAKIFVVRKNLDEVDLNIYQENDFTKKIATYTKDLIIKDEIDFRKINEGVKKMLNSEMGKMDADLCLPLFSEKNLIGFFILKQKDSDSLYSDEALKELLLMKKDLEIGLMNILLKLNLEEENNLMKSIIDEKTKELKDKIEEINELVQQQSDFIAVTAHEFRTPLSIAAFQMEDILHSKGDLNKKLDELKIVDDSIIDLKLLTEKLFAIQQYDLNKVALNLERVELKKFLKKIHKEFSPIMKEKHIHFDLKIETKKSVNVKIDSLQMRQVMHNLLKNASKFTHEKGTVFLKLKITNEHAIIYVEDNGEGIPDELKKSIFEKFRTKSSGAGIGLGLYLCKKTVELHKGKIWVENASTGGASFQIELNLLGK